MILGLMVMLMGLTMILDNQFKVGVVGYFMLVIGFLMGIIGLWRED